MGHAALGAKLTIQDETTATVFNQIGGVENISGPGLSMDMVEVTMANSRWEEVIPSILRTGEITFDLNLDISAEGTHQTLIRRLRDYTKASNRLIFPDENATTWEFDAYVTGFSPTMNAQDKLSAAVTFKLTGAPSL